MTERVPARVTALRNVYLAQRADGAAIQQSRVSNTPSHVGVICTEGIACAPGTRRLLDLFTVTLDPRGDRAAVIDTGDTITQTNSGTPALHVVLAQQK